ncbi:MAG: RNA 2',3'-cyclic phosphodiesterase [Desulfovermiculus sp.]|nr:RNA 2',3'-cyclic phosphodiesterase [Desulfovermiculus sp.]
MATRCFVAVPLPEAYQQALPEMASAWESILRSKMTWTKQGNWHLTLSFLGELEPEMLASVQEVLPVVPVTRFSLQASGGGFFPPGKNPRVIWIGIRQGAQECIRLAQKIEQALHPLGFPPSSRPFRPHLTVARVKHPRPDDWSQVLKWLQKREWPVFEVTKYVLYASRLTPQGPEYRVLNEYPLEEEFANGNGS